MYAPHVQDEYEDIVSILRIKVWRALCAFDPARSSMPVQRYVFSCVKNQAKDLVKKRRRNEVYIEDIAHGESDVAYFDRGAGSAGADQVYADVERELPQLPSTLTNLEREIIVRLYLDLTQRQVAATLCISRTEMDRSMRSIREKLATLPERALAAAA
jgi:RNA polymerase sigma factor (sigma-70 family)